MQGLHRNIAGRAMTNAQEAAEVLPTTKVQPEKQERQGSAAAPFLYLAWARPEAERLPEEPVDVLPALGDAILWLGG